MSEQNVFLVAENHKGSSAEFKEQVITLFNQMKLIDGYYTAFAEPLGWYASIKKRGISVLIKMKLISEDNESLEDPRGWYAPGENGSLIFSNPEELGGASFEYVIIHGTENYRLVPDASTAGYGAICSHCQSGIDSELYELLNRTYNEEYESNSEIDMSTLSVVCEKCNRSTPLRELATELETTLSNKFINMCNIYDYLDDAAVKDFSDRLGCRFRVLYERM